jgi:hypothetical protein
VLSKLVGPSTRPCRAGLVRGLQYGEGKPNQSTMAEPTEMFIASKQGPVGSSGLL